MRSTRRSFLKLSALVGATTLLESTKAKAAFYNTGAFWKKSSSGSSSSVDVGDAITHSILFDTASSQYLSRSPATTGNQKMWTFSAWVKPSRFGSQQPLFSCGTGVTNYATIMFSANSFYNANDTLKFIVVVSNSAQIQMETTALFRDPAAWYHIMVVLDTTQATASNRVKIYVNGSQVTNFITATYPGTQNMNIGFFNSTNSHQLGSLLSGSYGYYSGYMSEVFFIDGQSLGPTSFGRTSTQSGAWVPKTYSGSYGTNGFHLGHTNSNPIGKDGTTTLVSANLRTIGTAIGDAWNFNSGVMTNAFDGSTANAYAAGCACIQSSTTATGKIGRDWGSGNTKTIVAYRAYGDPTYGFSSATGQTITFELYGTTDGTTTGGTLLHTTTIAVGTGGEGLTVQSGINTTTAYRSHYLKMTENVSAASHVILISELEFYESGTNDTLSNDWTFNNYSLRTSGTVIGDAWNGNTGAVANAFDNSTANAYGAGCPAITSTTTATGKIGKDWGAGNLRTITGYKAYGAPTYGFSSAAGQNITFELYGTTDGTTTGGTLLHTTTIAVGTSSETLTVRSGVNVSTAYRSHYLKMTENVSAGSHVMLISELEFFDDSMFVMDSPTNNFCTYTPLNTYSGNSLSVGNLRTVFPGATQGRTARCTHAVSSGKWYWEATIDYWNTNGPWPGLIRESSEKEGNVIPGNTNATPDGGSAIMVQNNVCYVAQDGVGTNITGQVTWASNGDIVSVAADIDAGKMWFRQNGGSWILGVSGSSGNPSTGTNPSVLLTTGKTYFPAVGGSTSAQVTLNFGQGGQIGLTYDSASGGKFKYTPPSGFKALCTANLPAPTIAKPSQYFDVLTYSGSGGSGSQTSLSFQPDLVWVKGRSATTSHRWTDSSRGGGKSLFTDSTVGESTNDVNGYISGFLANGFSLAMGSTNEAGVNAIGTNYLSWTWKKGSTPGFNIVTYTGTLSSAGNMTVAHGLSGKPAMYISKSRNTNGADVGMWFVWHQSFESNKFLRMNTNDGKVDSVATGGGTLNVPDTTNFFPTYNSGAGVTGNNYVAYVFAEIEGFSKFGSYTGNGLADGPFVWCGFRPRWIMFKRYDSTIATGNWVIIDTVRQTYNVMGPYILADSSAVESSYAPMDILSNGFKIRLDGATGPGTNASGGVYIFAAFAEVPFKYARAR